MIDVLNRYGIQPNKAGFIPCPFHAEHTASCKSYPDSFYCFGCHASGDIFTFIQKMENCGFKRAYEILGGTYDGKGVSDVALLHIAKRRSLVLSVKLDGASFFRLFYGTSAHPKALRHIQ